MSVNSDDFDGLEKLAEVAGKDFVNGIVLYLGDQLIPFGKNLFAVPLQMLWG